MNYFNPRSYLYDMSIAVAVAGAGVAFAFMIIGKRYMGFAWCMYSSCWINCAMANHGRVKRRRRGDPGQ